MHISPSRTQTGAYGGAILVLPVSRLREQRNSAKTASDPAVFPIAEPLTAQDFRGERDVVG